MLRQVSRLRVAALCAGGLLACGAAAAEDSFRRPVTDETFAAGDAAQAAWTSPCERTEADEAELVLSLDDGITFPIRLTGEIPACASSHRWRVPAVASSRARLGLRKGREGAAEEERIVLVSARFSIVAVAAGGSGLTRGAIEWWTDEALFEFDAEDLLDQTLGREPDCVGAFPTADEADDPGSRAFPLRVEMPGALTPVASPRRPAPERLAARPVGALVPLRL